MPFDSIITRSDASALIPEAVAREIAQNVSGQSVVMTLGRRAPDMPTNRTRMPVLSAVPTAYFRNGDTGLRQTTQAAWGNKWFDAEELDAIVPISEAVLEDADYDIWGQLRPLIEMALGQRLDRAVLLGENAPSSWPDDIKTGATSAGHVVDRSTSAAAGKDLYDMLLGEGGVNSFVEEDAYLVTGHVANLGMKAKLRGLRTKVWDGSAAVATGLPIFHKSSDRQDMQAASVWELDGEQVMFPTNGALVASDPHLITGDWRQLLWTLRQDIRYKVLDQAVIQDSAGNILYNLAQQGMVALMVTMRIAWQLPNPINLVNENEATRYPFALLTE